MNIERYMLKALTAAVKAGYSILDVYHSDFTVERKADRSPVTLADRRSHEVLVSHLRELDIPMLSEEGKEMPYDVRKSWEQLWIVDPLDGTKEFISRNGEFTVNIALVKNGKPIFGVIYVPVRNVIYYAAEGIGAYKLEHNHVIDVLRHQYKNDPEAYLCRDIVNESKVLRAQKVKKGPVIIVGSRSHGTTALINFIEEKKREYGEIDFISAGSSLKFCLVAEGIADMYPRFGPTMEWDTAAGHAIAEIAGARVLDFYARTPLRYNKEKLENPSFIVVRSGLKLRENT